MFSCLVPFALLFGSNDPATQPLDNNTEVETPLVLTLLADDPSLTLEGGLLLPNAPLTALLPLNVLVLDGNALLADDANLLTHEGGLTPVNEPSHLLLGNRTLTLYHMPLLALDGSPLLTSGNLLTTPEELLALTDENSMMRLLQTPKPLLSRLTSLRALGGLLPLLPQHHELTQTEGGTLLLAGNNGIALAGGPPTLLNLDGSPLPQELTVLVL